jgi:GNAT superfamily N-acetyltransferase
MEIRPLASTHLNHAVETLTRAFFDDPIYVHIFPDPTERQRRTPSLWQAELGYCLRFGEVYTTPGIEGVAACLKPGDAGFTWWRMIQTRFATVRAVRRLTPDARRTMSFMYGAMDRARERLMPMPHWYLWAIGVDPDHQGKGIGSALIDSILKRATVPWYLETETESNVAFYERRGFRVIETEDLGVPVWYMRRD